MKDYGRGGGIVAAVIVFFILLFVYTKLAGPIPFTVNNINTINNTPFEVTGEGIASAAPDEVIINLGIREEASSALEAQESVNSSSEKLVDNLKDIGVEEKNIKTINYSVNPKYDFSDGSQTIVGYTIEQNFEVKAPIEIANNVIDASTKSGANVIGNLRFKINDEKEIELKNQARREAVDEAKKSAEGLAKVSGIKLGKIINVRENFDGITPRPFTLEARGELDESIITQTNITPGESNINVTVVLTYETL